MFRVFIDESGINTSDPTLVVAAFVGRTEDWEKLSDEWLLALEADNLKPLVLHNGERYFKHSEARGCRRCFAGFSEDEAEEKTVNLASIITRYDVDLYGLTLERKLYFRLVDEVVVRKSGKYYNDYVKDPLAMSLTLLVQLVLQRQYATNPNDNVDFIFDSGEMSDRVISIFNFIRDEFPGSLPPIMGTLIPMDDKKVMPLQAVDLLAGQIRMGRQSEVVFTPLSLLGKMDRHMVRFIGEREVRFFLATANISISIRRLKAMKRAGEKEREE